MTKRTTERLDRAKARWEEMGRVRTICGGFGGNEEEREWVLVLVGAQRRR